MLIRYRWWNRDGLDHHVTSAPGVPEGKVIFFDKDNGIADVRQIEAIQALLGNAYDYEVAYEEYGVSFDENGNQVDMEIPGIVPAEAVTDVAFIEDVTVSEKPKRGRPKKGQ